MPVIKYTMFFRDTDGYGFSESHSQNVASTTPNLSVQLANFVSAICTPRASMLAEDVIIDFARASYPRNGAIASLPVGVNLPGLPGVGGAGEAQSIAALMFNSGSNAKKNIHLRGIPRLVIKDGEFDSSTPEGALWLGYFNTYKAALVAGAYGWPTKDPANSVKGANVQYVEGTDGRVTFTLPQPGIPDPGGTRQIEVRFSGFNNRSSILNRQILCKWVDTVTLVSINQIGAGPMQTTGKFNYRVTTFNTYTDASKLTAGTRRAGKVLGRLPGRSRAQRLY